MEISAVVLILFLAFMVRMLPIRWGFYLSEFDPYFQYRLTKHMVENGFLAWLDWHDTASWYPYGRDIAQTSFPGLPLTAAFFYRILYALGIPLSLYDFTVVFPPIMATTTCLVMYFLGKDVGGKEVGLLSALFMALNSSYIQRTSLGFFDDETVGVLGMVLFSYLFLRSLDGERPHRLSFLYAIFAGLTLGYVCISWGAARYALGVAAIFVVALVLLRRYSTRLLISYSAVFGVTLLMSVVVPRLGVGFLLEPVSLAVLGLFGLLFLMEIFQRVNSSRGRLMLGMLFMVAGVAAAFIFAEKVTVMEAKFIGVINPFARSPLVQSVAEHRPSAWGSFYYDLGIGAFFLVIGVFFTLQRPSNRNLFFSVFGLTALYSASSMVRLMVLSAPAFSVLWALGLVGVVKPFITVMKEAPTIPSRRMRLEAHVGKEFGGAFLILMLLLLTFAFVFPMPGQSFPRVFVQADSPVTIAAASLPIKPEETTTDWLDALIWMRSNESVRVVASWWDYGYWITTIANKTTLVDNATINQTQIQLVAKMFLSNETEAIKFLKEHDVTHVLVFVVADYQGSDTGWADEGKWRWMARIAEPLTGLNDTAYFKEDSWNERGQNTVIFKLMEYAKGKRISTYNVVYGTQILPQLQHFRLVYFSNGKLVLGTYYPIVAIYEVLYE